MQTYILVLSIYLIKKITFLTQYDILMKHFSYITSY
jgi:hypothetical protein